MGGRPAVDVGLGSGKRAGIAGVGVAISEAGTGSGAPEALPRPGRKSVRITRDPTLNAGDGNWGVDKKDDRAGPGRMLRAKVEPTFSAENGTARNGSVPVK